MEVKKGYAPVDGLRTHYEIHGATNSAQPPLMLLHGGGDTIQTSFGSFARHRSHDTHVSNCLACPHDQRFSRRAHAGVGIERVASRPMRRL